MNKMKYDFKAARQRIETLKSYYRRLAYVQPKDGGWDWWLAREIDALEQQIKQAHKNKKTA